MRATGLIKLGYFLVLMTLVALLASRTLGFVVYPSYDRYRETKKTISVLPIVEMQGYMCTRSSDCCTPELGGAWVGCFDGVCELCAPGASGCYQCPSTTTISTTTTSTTSTTSTTTTTTTTTRTTTTTTLPSGGCPTACDYVWTTCRSSFCGDNAGCDCWYSNKDTCTGRFTCCEVGDPCDCDEECPPGVRCIGGICGGSTTTTSSTSTTSTTTLPSCPYLCTGVSECYNYGGICHSEYYCDTGCCCEITTTTTTTTLPACDSSSYTSCSNAYDFGSSSGSKTYMCGDDQYYKVSTPTGKQCDITWTMTPDSSSDYDLYVKWSGECPSTSSYDCRPYEIIGSQETCSVTGFMGTTYALVHKYSGSGHYNISVSVTNCQTPSCPSTPPSYPTDRWDRVWCNKNFDTWLADSPDESSTTFDTDWGSGNVGGIRRDDIGFRSGRKIYFYSKGYYEFSVGSDDGVRLWIDGTKVLDKWQDRSYTVDKFVRYLSSGYHNFRLDYYENTAGARVSFDYKYLGPVVLYTDTNYGGGYLGLTGNDADLSDNTENGCLVTCSTIGCIFTWNDCASSLKVTSGYTAILFEDTNYGGRSIAFTSSVSDLGSYNFNDKASSVKVIHGVAPCATTDTSHMCSVSCGRSGTSSYISSDSPGYWKFTLSSSMNVTITTHTPSGLDSKLLVGTTPGGSDICYVDRYGSGSSESCNKILSQGTYYITIKSYSGTGNDYPSISCTTPPVTCDSTSYTSCDSAYDFGKSSGTKSYMCGDDQYYTVSAPSGKKCTITWTVTPDSSSDYDLYVKWSGECPSTSSYDCKSMQGTGSTESCTSSEKILVSYALVHRHSGSGHYNISVSISNCEDSGCIACGDPTCNGWICDCWRKMKNEDCSDLDWYDFATGGYNWPKCAIKPSSASHYDHVGNGWWCPETEPMWKAIRCGGGWPSGSFSDGEKCKVWYICGVQACYKEGVWDPDDNKCIITNDNGNSYPGCTSDHRENPNADYAADYCGSSGKGDGYCEEACGASPLCDEKEPNKFYDLDGDDYEELFCDSNCQAHVCDENHACESITWYGDTYKCTYVWVSSSRAVWKWQYWSGDMSYLEDKYGYGEQECSDRYDNDCDGDKNCRDSGCRGVAGCCYYDSDCPVNQTTHVRGKCCSPYGHAEKDVCPTYDYKCKYKRCKSNSDCEDGYCCTHESNPGPGEDPGRCVKEGTIVTDVYFCDPIEGWGSDKTVRQQDRDILFFIREALRLFGLEVYG